MEIIKGRNGVGSITSKAGKMTWEHWLVLTQNGQKQRKRNKQVSHSLLILQLNVPSKWSSNDQKTIGTDSQNNLEEVEAMDWCRYFWRDIIGSHEQTKYFTIIVINNNIIISIFLFFDALSFAFYVSLFLPPPLSSLNHYINQHHTCNSSLEYRPWSAQRND